MAYTAAQEFQYIDDILKEFYAPAIVNQVYKKAPFWAQIQKLVRGVYGKRVVIPITTAFSEAVGARRHDEYHLPTALKSTFDTSYIYMKRNYGRIQIDGFAIESAKGKGGWVDIVSAETKNIASAFGMDIDRQTLGRGDAIIGHEAGSTSNTYSLIVDNPFGITEASSARLFRIGMVLDVLTGATTNTDRVANCKISGISSNTLTVDQNVDSGVDGDAITRKDAYDTAEDTCGEMMGLDGIVDSTDFISTSAFQGILSSDDSAGLWHAYKDTTSQVISETVLQELLDGIEQSTDGDTVNLAMTTYLLRNKLIELMQADRLVSSMDLKAGWKAIKYIGGSIELPIMVHKNCPTGYFYAIALPHIKFYTLKKMSWDNKGGGIIKPVADTDAYEAWFKMYGNIGTDCRNSSGKLTGLTAS